MLGSRTSPLKPKRKRLRASWPAAPALRWSHEDLAREPYPKRWQCLGQDGIILKQLYIYRLYIIYLFKYNLYIIYIIIYIHGFVSWNVGFGLILVGIFAKFDAWKGQSYPLTIILWRYPRGFSANMGDFTTPFGGGLDHFQTDPNIRLFGISDTQIVRIPGKVLLYPSMFHVMHIINMYKYVCKCHL